ncbi:MAG TPA: ATP-binding cassette domain-containing protein [Guyparkeria sp.]|nr:ATP-binding cassette domain-containing protein [Guyparkeria sp.]
MTELPACLDGRRGCRRQHPPPSPPQTEVILRLQNVSRWFEGGAGVTDLNLELHAGEILGICGMSGCGKSTLLRLIANLEQPDQGTIERRHQRPGMVFQEDQLLPWLTARENVELVLPKHANADARRTRLAQAEAGLEEVGLQEARNQYPAQLSGGMRQRVGIARALAGSPDLLLLDEPFASLDYFTSLQLLDLVASRVQERSIGAVFVSHDVREIARLCDRVLVMGGRPGRLLAAMPNPLPASERETRPGTMAAFEKVILDSISAG